MCLRVACTSRLFRMGSLCVLCLLEFYVFFWVADSDKVFSYAVAVVSLEHDQAVFVCSATGAE